MSSFPLLVRFAMAVVLIAVAFATASCDNVSGVGVGVGTTARWGGSTSGPPIFVGGPSR